MFQEEYVSLKHVQKENILSSKIYANLYIFINNVGCANLTKSLKLREVMTVAIAQSPPSLALSLFMSLCISLSQIFSFDFVQERLKLNHPHIFAKLIHKLFRLLVGLVFVFLFLTHLHSSRQKSFIDSSSGLSPFVRS